MAKPKAQEDPPRQVAAAPVPPDARNELEATISALQKLHKAQSQARELRQEAAAAAATSPAAHDRLLEAAREKEVEARGYGKMVRRMQSGTWQGLFGGGGIGVGVGMGLGAVLGTLAGSLLTVPTTLLGGLVGSGVGAVHGPWIKVGDVPWEDASPGDVADAIEREQKLAKEKPADETRHQERAEEQQSCPAQVPKGRKKPRKIEIRSPQVGASMQTENT